MKTTFTVQYFSTNTGQEIPSHSYQETWERLPEMFCPNCGKQSVWADDGPGDYYEGPQHICTSCKHDFTLPSGVRYCGNDRQDTQRLKAISEA